MDFHTFGQKEGTMLWVNLLIEGKGTPVFKCVMWLDMTGTIAYTEG